MGACVLIHGTTPGTSHSQRQMIPYCTPDRFSNLSGPFLEKLTVFVQW